MQVLSLSSGMLRGVQASSLHSASDICPCTQPDLAGTAAQVAILHLYNVVNKRLPGWQEPPTRVRIKAALAEFDTNHDGVLNKQVC